MQWVGIRRSVSFDIGEAEADPTGESTAGLAGPVESVAGEATIDRIASTAEVFRFSPGWEVEQRTSFRLR